ncbi:MAG: polyphosphate polymerase domain-containing protein [Clostridia bacterium]|nr:polyphosphate polymerase domain-containing protein [Clostridia bacterium]
MNAPIITCFERYEKKYFLNPGQLAAFTKSLAPFVRADAYGQYTICNVYYDTDDYRLIRTSLEKPVYKEKLRVRSYGVPDTDGTVFVELKKKYDGVVYKRRITAAPRTAQMLLRGIRPAGEQSQIQKEIEYFRRFHEVAPKVFIAYDRQAFQGVDNSALRITFDRNMRYRLDRPDLLAGDDGLPILQSDDVLMEVKIPGTCPLWLSRLLSEHGIYPTSFSKYGECYNKHILKANQTESRKELTRSA